MLTEAQAHRQRENRIVRTTCEVLSPVSPLRHGYLRIYRSPNNAGSSPRWTNSWPCSTRSKPRSPPPAPPPKASSTPWSPVYSEPIELPLRRVNMWPYLAMFLAALAIDLIPGRDGLSLSARGSSGESSSRPALHRPFLIPDLTKRLQGRRGIVGNDKLPGKFGKPGVQLLLGNLKEKQKIPMLALIGGEPEHVRLLG